VGEEGENLELSQGGWGGRNGGVRRGSCLKRTAKKGKGNGKRRKEWKREFAGVSATRRQRDIAKRREGHENVNLGTGGISDTGRKSKNNKGRKIGEEDQPEREGKFEEKKVKI